MGERGAEKDAGLQALICGLLAEWAGDFADLDDCRSAAEYVAPRLSQSLAHAWEQGAYAGREYQKRLHDYRQPTGMGRHPEHVLNPYVIRPIPSDVPTPSDGGES